MHYKSLFPAILTFLILISCSTGPKPAEDKSNKHSKLLRLEWLIGSWANISEEGEYYETWTRVNDSVFTAFSYMTITGDTVFSEQVSLELSGGDLYYIVTVGDQNGGNPVSFKLVSDAGGEFIFENKQHDFPQRIIYKNPSPDSLHARIEGIIGGELKAEDFPLHRLNPKGSNMTK
jgi:hypothetical protein